MPIQLPEQRAYYLASQMAPYRLLCWIPPGELEEMAAAGSIRKNILDDYPDGLEIPVTEDAFGEEQLQLSRSPEALAKTFLRLWKAGRIPDAGMVAGPVLEEEAEHPDSPPGREELEAVVESVATYKNLEESDAVSLAAQTAPPPEIADGERPADVLRKLASKGGS